MNTLLETAYAEVAKLSPDQQDDFARWILAELANIQRWNKSAAQTADSLEWFADWCKADPSHRLVSLFTDHLTEENKELMGLLNKARVLNEAKLSGECFAARGATFMHTKGPHDQVPVDYFGRLLPSFDPK